MAGSGGAIVVLLFETAKHFVRKKFLLLLFSFWVNGRLKKEFADNIIYALTLKILSYRKLKLVDEDLLEGIEVVLLVENEHRLLVVNGIDGAETQWAIAVGN